MKTLVTVDDEAAIILILRTYFDGKYNVVSMSNGQDALEFLESGKSADIILADLNMPQMDGLEFIRKVRDIYVHKDTPLIVLSSEESSARRIECFRLGADDYLGKPFNPEELDVRIEKALLHHNKLA